MPILRSVENFGNNFLFYDHIKQSLPLFLQNDLGRFSIHLIVFADMISFIFNILNQVPDPHRAALILTHLPKLQLYSAHLIYNYINIFTLFRLETVCAFLVPVVKNEYSFYI